VRLADLVTPVAPPDRHDRELGEDNGAADGRGHLLGALDSEPDVAVVVADDDEGLEPRALTGAGLLLHGRDLHHLVLEPRHELVHDLVLLHGQRVEVDLLDGVDPVLLHEAAELGHRHPLLLLRLTATATAAAAPTAVTAPTASEAAAEAAALAATLRHGGWGLWGRWLRWRENGVAAARGFVGGEMVAAIYLQRHRGDDGVRVSESKNWAFGRTAEWSLGPQPSEAVDAFLQRLSELQARSKVRSRLGLPI
jgi:hypothetical protein